MGIDEAITPPKEDDLPQREIQDWNNLFNLKPANEWLEDEEKRPAQSALFGDFWLEGELSILFSDTDRGKSILAVQIAEALARGKAIEPMDIVPPAQKVLYFDFEMTEKQFAARYSTAKDESAPDGSLREHYRFSENFLRAQAALHDELPHGYKNLTAFTYFSFQELLRRSRARAVIVDNITFLKGANQNVAAAAQLMKGLKYIKDCYGISILVLAHTPKRPFTAPLSIHDLQGSNMLSNFADNVFAMGGSNQEKELRYLKHIKLRGSGIRHDASNIVLYRLAKKDGFLQFEFAGYGRERDHLIWDYETSADRRRELKAEARRLKLLGKSQHQIALQLAVSPATVSRYLEEL
jgi:hypothetical protein